jgi:uncharacterized protein YyaL (SSP411 family)
VVEDRVGKAHALIRGGAELDREGGLVLDGVDDYVDMPNGVLSSRRSVTIIAWLHWAGGTCWQRIFDFGSTDAGEGQVGRATTSLFLTPASCPGFVITSMTERESDQQEVAAAHGMPTDRTVQVALVLDGDAAENTLYIDGRLAATYKDGRAHLNAYLDDYALLSAAQLELLQDEFSSAELGFALELADVLLEQFEDPAQGGFFFTARDHERLILRPKPAHDHATPSGNAVAAWALGRLAALTGEARYARAAERTLQLFHPAMLQQPGGFAMTAIALEEHLAQPKTLVLRGRPEPLRAWQDELAREYLPDTLVLAIADGAAGVPALLDKPARPGDVNAWLCRGVSCLEPSADLVHLKHTLKEKA